MSFSAAPPPLPPLPPPAEIIEVPIVPERTDTDIQEAAKAERRRRAQAVGKQSTLLGGSSGALSSAISGGTLLGA